MQASNVWQSPNLSDTTRSDHYTLTLRITMLELFDKPARTEVAEAFL